MRSTIDERLNELEKKANSEFVTLSDLTAINQELDEIDPVPKTKELPQDVSLYIPDISEAPAGKIFKTSIRKVEVEAINFDEEFREETETALYNELSQISNDSFVKAALLRLCERVEELESD